MVTAKPNWLKTKPSEVEKIVVELGKKGHAPEEIGTILRDQHGIPKAKLLGKRITKIMKENKIKMKPEKEKVEERIIKLKTHIEKNKHDYPAQRSLTKELWAIYHIAKAK